ncbi:GMC oxidoreductase [Deinococcus sp. QL22]|uniref:GMC oxidoreductase n=1 Tax=Deinococcus sp. QL22 TaxID=2939437 RepID=UPI002018167A|nr:GMC oxidoreductase [Deinococcus sp. QL22]UQN07964.1 GMC oxidoreductase [Deinococcus sp. QL22]
MKSSGSNFSTSSFSHQLQENVAVDVLVIGSGPVGSTYSRIITEARPNASVLMIDAGPALTKTPGLHLSNLYDDVERVRLQVLSQGSSQFRYRLRQWAERASPQALEATNEARASLLGFPGTYLTNTSNSASSKNCFPAASHSTNVGGMGVHWTCACPRPSSGERASFIAQQDWNRALAKAEALLSVTTRAYLANPVGLAILKKLGEIYNPNLLPEQEVQPMPLACELVDEDRRAWSGPETVLGRLATAEHPNFSLRSETVCRELITTNGKVTGAVLEYRPTKRRYIVPVGLVIVAADALRTPQLLWASGIRPAALGHYLNDHPMVTATVVLKEEFGVVAGGALPRQIDDQSSPGERVSDNDPFYGVYWIPFDAHKHPYHGQVMLKASSLVDAVDTQGRQLVGLSWYCTKQPSFENYLQFSEIETDFLGLPKITIHYKLTDLDLKAIEGAKQDVDHAAGLLGKYVDGGVPTAMPVGMSLHYQGTIRMGPINDGTSVCDSRSKVWGFDNLYVGGNGVISTATACNPTLTSVALAVLASEDVVSRLPHNAEIPY